MKKHFPFILALLLFSDCLSQNNRVWTVPQIVTTAKDSFEYAITFLESGDKEDLELFNRAAAIIVPERMGDEESIFPKNNKVGFILPCQCAFNKDTLTIITGIGWEGAFAYLSQSTLNSSTVYYQQSGKNRRWKLGETEYKSEVEIPSNKNTLFISHQLPLIEGQQLFGWFDVETPEYLEFEKDDDTTFTNEKHILRIYFSCKVYPDIY